MSPELVAVLAVIFVALAFDYTNGFHDAANAIATSVSTRALTPGVALLMAAVGNLLYLYGLTKLPSLPREMHELVEVLDQQAKLTADAMPRLKSMKDLEDYWIECNRLENEGDQAYRMLLVRLFSGEYDALTVLKMKEVADELEAACDAFEHVANTVETIAVKES